MKMKMYSENCPIKVCHKEGSCTVHVGVGAVVAFITTGFPKVIDGSKQAFYFSVLSYVWQYLMLLKQYKILGASC